jgi:hypothetical protein
LPDFSWYNTPKRIKYTKNYKISRSNDHKTSPSKIYPNLDFWFENMSSGNPVPHSCARENIKKKLFFISLRLGKVTIKFREQTLLWPRRKKIIYDRLEKNLLPLLLLLLLLSVLLL